MSTPKLRFNGFNEDWSDYTINDITESLKSGLSRLLHHQDIGMPVIRANNIDNGQLTYNDLKYWYINDPQGADTKNYIVHKNDILINFINSEAKMGTTAIILEEPFREMIYTTNILKMNTNELADNYFFYCYTGTKKYKDYIKLITKPAVNQASFTTVDFKKHSIKIPTVTEQTKISSFFKLINKKIQLQQEKIDLLKEQKKGFMQKVFSQELRFKDEKGHEYPNWKKQFKAEQLFEPISNKNHNGEYPVLSASQEHGMVYRDSLDRQMSFNDDNLGSYKLVEQEDFIISLRSFQGGIEFSNLQGLVSPAYTVFRKKSDMVHELYFAKLFKTDNFIMRLNATTYGIRDGKAISYKDFSTLKFDIPCLEEQIKIAKFLDAFDKKISRETVKLSHLISHKQYFMQQMFI